VCVCVCGGLRERNGLHFPVRVEEAFSAGDPGEDLGVGVVYVCVCVVCVV